MSDSPQLPKPERPCDHGKCDSKSADNLRRCKTDGKQYRYCDEHDPLEDDRHAHLWEQVGGGE